MKRFFLYLLLSAGVVLALGAFHVALAQDEDEDSFTLEEITVTAQKRAENQQKVAIAMEVVTGEELKALGRNDIDEILSNVSSVLIQSANDGLRVSVRGISNDNNAFRNIQASAPTVAVNKDGVYSNRSGNNQSLYDIERVEVLFGPQSTMYASASPGGIVNIVTANPKTDVYSASGTLEYGNYDLLHTEGSVNVPVSDIMALRGSFTTSVRNGYLSNGSDDEDSKSARLKALVAPNESFSFVLTGEITKSGGQGFASIEAFEDQDDVSDPWTSAEESAGMGRDENQKKITAQMDLDIGIGTMSVIPSYVKNSNYSAGTTTGMAMPGQEAPTYYTTREGKGSEKGVEARLSSSEDSGIQWNIGANMYKAEDEQHQVNENQTDETAETEYNDQWNEQDTKAVYANLTYPVTNRFRAIVGARNSWDTNETVNIEVPGKGGVDRTEEGSKMEYDSPNFKVGVQYDIGEDSMLYADISSSYRLNAGGVTPGGVQLPPEELMAYQIGSKNRFFNKRLQLNAAAYYYDYADYYANMPPSRIPIDYDGDGEWDPATETDMEELVNMETGDAVVYGLDIQTTTIITDNDKLDFSVSYIKKYFKDLVFDFPDIVNSFGIDDLDYSDKDMPQAPNWKFNASYAHNFQLPNGGTLKATVDANYTSKTCLNWMAKSLNINIDTESGSYEAYVSDTSNVRWQEAYYMGNASLSYIHSDDKWSLTAYVNNIENYAVKRFLDGQGNMMIGNPRTYGATLTMHF